MIQALTAGFADPVLDAQRSFRAVLDAMARPGSVHVVAGTEAPAPLTPALGAVLLTLVDHETPLWLDPALDAARDWIAFHTGAPFTPHADRARFAVAGPGAPMRALHPGGHETPEESATLLLRVGSLSDGAALRLRGPGLRAPVLLRVAGLPNGFVGWWGENHRRFPLGVDVILCAGDRLAALPRTVIIEEA